jgi:Fe-S-cluster-containing hydrogenase component 2/CRP-like cAMP-binding protein
MPDSVVVEDLADDRDLMAPSREEESLFARGDDDALMKYVKPTQQQFKEMVKLTIDGEFIEVPKAKPATDAQGNLRKGPDGLPIPRATTIYDAAVALVEQGKLTADDLSRRIPILCHQQHLDPVAMCRMCSVHISNIKRGKFTAGRKLVPACQHRVEEKMAVLTRQGPADVGRFLGVLNEKFQLKPEDLPAEKDVGRFVKLVQDATYFLGELLVADHLHPDPARDDRFRNELDVVAQVLGVGTPQRCSSLRVGKAGRNFDASPKARPLPTKVATLHADLPYSSRSIQVDHDRCILCDRCARSCSQVKPFKVIGHTGKGYRSRISFDLDQLMNESSCVQCGECMSACPTGALTLNRRVSPKSWPDNPKIPEDPRQPLPEGFLSADELCEVKLTYEEGGRTRTLYPFRDISYPYLRWNEGAVRRRQLRPGDLVCREGEFGSTAFLLVDGEFAGEQTQDDAEPMETAEAPTGFLSFLRGGRSASRAKQTFSDKFTMLARRDLILGEIACLTNTRRTATVTAATPAVVLEMTRNMLTMLQRNPSARKVLDAIYSRRAIRACLIKSELFEGMPRDERKRVVAEFQKDAEVLRVGPGETIVHEGDRIGLDEKGDFHGDFYIILLGFVKVSQTSDGQEHVLANLGPSKYFGEIALLPDHPLVTSARQQYGINPSQRTATVTALADVEVVRVPGRTFRKFFKPTAEGDSSDPFVRIARRIAELTVKRLRDQHAPAPLENDRLGDFLRQGLYQGQKMFVLDLKCCTRCDECTKACADAHGDGHSRLLREGLRYGDFLVAASCRSCFQPYCMDGCPVDAIHRDNKSLEILIESHCIGCSLCDRSCPYGSIQMVPDRPKGRWSDLFPEINKTPSVVASVKRRAINCDLCHDLVKPGEDTFCVAACPHKAAFRWSGEKLKAEVEKRGG